MTNDRSSVAVAIRVRPKNSREQKTAKIVSVNDNNISLINNEHKKSHNFSFDYVFDEDSKQSDVYDTLGVDIINNTHGGYNSCVLAYGQTGCFAMGTKIMLYDGTYKNIEFINKKDIIMGDDSEPRKIMQLFRGTQSLYQVNPKPHKLHIGNEKYSISHIHTSYTVNQDHILIILNPAGVIEEISIDSYFNKYVSWDDPNPNTNLIMTSVEFNYQHAIDPFDAGKNQTVNAKYIYNTKAVRLLYLAGLIKSQHHQFGDAQYNGKSYRVCVIKTNKHSLFLYVSKSLGFLTGIVDNNIVILKNTTIFEKDIGNVCEDIYEPYTEETTTHYYSFDIRFDKYGDFYGFMLNENHRFIGEGFNILRNSGKTHTMMGSHLDEGLIPNICRNLFIPPVINKFADEFKVIYKIELSYYEIYSERINDLLSDNENLKVRQHPENGPYIEGISKNLVNSYDAIRLYIEKGNKARTVAATLMNDRSSRSHAILTLYFTQLIEDPALPKPREILSKIHLVDLAGSEKVLDSGVTGTGFSEAVAINKSLSVLGAVIQKLVSKKHIPAGKKHHIPYRDSILTRLLSDSLGGNSKTRMIATISPSELYAEETLATLRYAQITKQIVNNARVNENPTDKTIRCLREEIKELKTLLANGYINNNKREELRQLELLQKDMERTWEEKMADSKRSEEQMKKQLQNDYLEQKRQLEQQMAFIHEQKIQQVEDEFKIKQQEFESNHIISALSSIQQNNDAIIERHNNEIRLIREEYDAKIRENSTNHTNRIKMIMDDYDNKINTIRKEYGDMLVNMRIDYEERLTSMKINYELDCEKKITDIVRNIESQYNNRIAILQELLNATNEKFGFMEQKNQRLELDLQEQKEDHRRDMNNLLNEIELREIKNTNSHKAQLDKKTNETFALRKQIQQLEARIKSLINDRV